MWFKNMVPAARPSLASLKSEKERTSWRVPVDVQWKSQRKYTGKVIYLLMPIWGQLAKPRDYPPKMEKRVELTSILYDNLESDC
jgi:hypothetical protein